MLIGTVPQCAWFATMRMVRDLILCSATRVEWRRGASAWLLPVVGSARDFSDLNMGAWQSGQ